MPVLDPIEGQFLMELANPNVKTIGRPRLRQLLTIVEKLHSGVQEANEGESIANFIANAFWLAASGIITEEMVLQNPRLSDQQKMDVLSIIQLRYDAEAWRGCTDYVPRQALPEANRVNPQATEAEANEELYTADRIG